MNFTSIYEQLTTNKTFGSIGIRDILNCLDLITKVLDVKSYMSCVLNGAFIETPTLITVHFPYISVSKDSRVRKSKIYFAVSDENTITINNVKIIRPIYFL